MANARKHAQQDMPKMDSVLVTNNALIMDADCVVRMGSVISVFLIIVDNLNVNGNSYFHHCSCHSLPRRSLFMLLCRRYSS